MAVTNFRAEDFPKGKGQKRTSPEREDNKVLEEEVENAVEDHAEELKPGRTPRTAARRKKAADDKIDAEVANTEEAIKDVDQASS